MTNGRPDSNYDCVEQKSRATLYADPWIRRCDQPSSMESIYAQERPRRKSIQYETRPYYRSLSSTSNDLHPSRHLQQHRDDEEQKSCQPLLGNVDKDIEYVESRLRGQSTVSPSASMTYAPDVTWRPASSQNYTTVLSTSPSNDPLQASSGNDQKYPSASQAKRADEIGESPSKSSIGKSQTMNSSTTNGSVKTVKSRVEKMKDQKAAKTLR